MSKTKMIPVSDKAFAPYGILLDMDTEEIVEFLNENSPMPEKNNLYVAGDPEFHKLASVKEMENKYFGEFPMEAGYCNGYNSLLNCMEYHGSIEIDIAATDAALILGTPGDIKEGKLASSDLKVFEMKKGQAVLLYPGTLHFSPCKLSDAGFKMGIFLPEGTNLDLKEKALDPKLWKINKWLIAHKDTNQAKLGAYVGITGENTEIKY